MGTATVAAAPDITFAAIPVVAAVVINPRVD
jgi:hypothetical protein